MDKYNIKSQNDLGLEFLLEFTNLFLKSNMSSLIDKKADRLYESLKVTMTNWHSHFWMILEIVIPNKIEDDKIKIG